MAHSVYNIPGLGGFLGMQDIQQQQEGQQIRQMIGLASLLERRKAAEQEAQLAPLKMQLMQAQADQARGLADERARSESFNQQLTELVKGSTLEDGTLDWGKLSQSMAQVPGGLKPAMELRKNEQDRAARVQQQEQANVLRQQQLNDQREQALRRAQNDAERLAAQRQYQQGMLALREDSIATRRALAAQGSRPPAGYRWKADGSMEPIPGGPGEDKQRDINERATDSLRKEFNSLPEVKNYRTVIPIIQSIKTAKDTPAGDLDFIYAVGKILDPDSVVREGEMNLVIKSGGPMERFKGAVNNVMGNGRLTPTIRANLMQMLTQRVSELERGYKAAETMYRTNAERRGLPTNEIFMDHGATDLPPPASSGPKPGFTKDGYRFKGGDPAKKENWERM